MSYVRLNREITMVFLKVYIHFNPYLLYVFEFHFGKKNFLLYSFIGEV